MTSGALSARTSASVSLNGGSSVLEHAERAFAASSAAVTRERNVFTWKLDDSEGLFFGLVRAVRRSLAVVTAAGLALAGCALINDAVRTAATVAVAPPAQLNHTSRSVLFKPVREVMSKGATASRPRVRTVAAPSGSPWAVFDGELIGPSHVVARVTGGGVNVSPQPEAAPALTLSNATSAGAPRTFVVLAEAGAWLQVLLPIRPNGSVGWVRRADVDVTSVSQRVVIDRAAHRLQVFDGDRLVVDDAIAVGKSSTPTPAGQFFVVELLQPTNPRGAYGPYAFTLSGYSEVYQTFGSGDGAIGLHGTNEPHLIGRDVSHGCVRVSNNTVRNLATFLPLGTPVLIR